MFLACGVGAFTAALFHLMTHAFFKALMFLGSGSVIHALDGEQDIRKMGGLKKYLPITHFTFMAGWVAIIGMPPFAGFFSKDEILWYSFASPQGSKFLWAIGFLAALCTAFYMTRLMALTFWGGSRVDKSKHPHESPWTMALPLCVLAVLSVIGGWFGIPHVISAILPGHPSNLLESWTHGQIAHVKIENASAALEWSLMSLSVLGAGIAAVIAYKFYSGKSNAAQTIAEKIQPLHTLIYNKYFVDEVYFGKIINPLIEISRGLWVYVDVNFIDKITYWISDLVLSAGGGVRALQSGNLQQYAMYVVLGMAGIIVALFIG
jgi:NADH-quinone oxidoreductase subunit L